MSKRTGPDNGEGKNARAASPDTQATPIAGIDPDVAASSSAHRHNWARRHRKNLLWAGLGLAGLSTVAFGGTVAAGSYLLQGRAGKLEAYRDLERQAVATQRSAGAACLKGLVRLAPGVVSRTVPYSVDAVDIHFPFSLAAPSIWGVNGTQASVVPDNEYLILSKPVVQKVNGSTWLGYNPVSQAAVAQGEARTYPVTSGVSTDSFADHLRFVNASALLVEQAASGSRLIEPAELGATTRCHLSPDGLGIFLPNGMSAAYGYETNAQSWDADARAISSTSLSTLSTSYKH